MKPVEYIYGALVVVACLLIFVTYLPAALLAAPYRALNCDLADWWEDLRGCYSWKSMKELCHVLRHPIREMPF